MQAEELQLKKYDKTSSDKKQIYILDDDESVRRSLKLLMISYGFAVDVFSSAKAGAVGFSQKPFEDHYLLHMVKHVFCLPLKKGEKYE
jgi:FixJ family two-component response regulator